MIGVWVGSDQRWSCSGTRSTTSGALQKRHGEWTLRYLHNEKRWRHTPGQGNNAQTLSSSIIVGPSAVENDLSLSVWDGGLKKVTIYGQIPVCYKLFIERSSNFSSTVNLKLRLVVRSSGLCLRCNCLWQSTELGMERKPPTSRDGQFTFIAPTHIARHSAGDDEEEETCHRKEKKPTIMMMPRRARPRVPDGSSRGPSCKRPPPRATPNPKGDRHPYSGLFNVVNQVGITDSGAQTRRVSPRNLFVLERTTGTGGNYKDARTRVHLRSITG
ncbi:hypothetical protein EDD15DRAFT_2519970 [Pisolithus albus]|nr:hypothetical protein EDD15DRAFT_2519970 [Pisolithus albus]